MISAARSAVATTRPRPISASSWSSELSVDSVSVSGIAKTTNWPPKESSGQLVTRKWDTPPVPSTVYGGAARSLPALGNVFGSSGLAVELELPNAGVWQALSTVPSAPRSSVMVPGGKLPPEVGPEQEVRGDIGHEQANHDEGDDSDEQPPPDRQRHFLGVLRT